MMRLHLPTSLLLLTFSTLLVTVAESFIIGGPKEIVTPNPDLLRFTEAQTGTLLNIRMDVAEAGLEAETRMGINGMTFELSDEAVEATKQNYPKLPGVNGPNPHLSSGSRKIKGTFQMTFKTVSFALPLAVTTVFPCAVTVLSTWRLISFDSCN